ncbi:MAG TPA: zf-HC2 domain-containing protein [Anaeromyxobacteraceae bacterium]|nr:zf-HC2 domain-containing protein [Anaeromyxobacteraceae bacterium]
MTRDAFQERLLDLAYGEISRREARSLEAHLAGCEACRAELERIRATRRAMAALAPEPAPERGEAVLLAAAREAARGKVHQRPPRLIPPWLWAGTLGALGAAAVVVVSLRVADVGRRPMPADALVASSQREASAPESAAPAPPAPGPFASAPPRADQGRPAAEATPLAVGPRHPAEVRTEKKAVARAEAPPAAGGAMAFAPPPASAPRLEPAQPGEAAAPPAGEQAGAASDRYAKAPERSRPMPSPAAVAPAAPAAAPGAVLADRRAASASSAMAKREESPPDDDPVALVDRLAAQGRLTTAPAQACPGEGARRVDRDPRGRVVRLTISPGTGDAREVEAFYAADGRLAAVRTTRPGGRSLARLEAADLAPGRAPHALPLDSREIEAGAAPRCP